MPLLLLLGFIGTQKKVLMKMGDIVNISLFSYFHL